MNMDINNYLQKTEDYLHTKLLPFWANRIAEPKFGGFQTNYDVNGCRTDVTEKTLLCQARTIFTLSHAIRMGYDWEGSGETIRQGIDFLFKHFRDSEHDGYYWIVEEDGRPRDTSKVLYGHSFLIYGLSEYALLTGDEESKKESIRLFDLCKGLASDLRYGGFYEHFNRTFELTCTRPDGVFHKSLDTHMHLMEAFTTLYELTGEVRHRRALEQMCELIFDRMIDPETGAGIGFFKPDWQPIGNIELDTVWGADRFDKQGKPAEITSYGHNIELAWLYLHAQDILGNPRTESLDRMLPIFEHTYSKGIDWELGGLYVEGVRDGEVTESTKEFWQQAEALIGFLDAYELTGDDKYLRAFANIHDFVFEKVINWEQGEWYPLLSRENEVLWDYMGTNWKICYHTLRGVCEVSKRLRSIMSKEEEQ
jgi:mannose 2-epimerase